MDGWIRPYKMSLGLNHHFLTTSRNVEQRLRSQPLISYSAILLFQSIVVSSFFHIVANGLVSSRPGEFHPKPLTEPYVIVSHHTALLKWYTKIAHPFSSWQAVYQISSSLCSISITETSSLLRMSPPLFKTSLFCL